MITRGKITPMKNNVLVKDMVFGETKTEGGIILLDDDGKSSGIHPRWATVYSVGSQVDYLKVGEKVLVEHCRWTRGIDVIDDKGEKLVLRMVDVNDILLVEDI